MKFFSAFISWLIFIPTFSCKGQSARTSLKTGNDTTYTYAGPSADGIGKFYFGREIAHVMGAAGASWLERPEREQEEATSRILKAFPMSDTSTVADIGAGTGFYTFKIANKLKKGTVFAIELQDDLIAYLNKEKKVQNAQNVIIIKGTEMKTNLPASSTDLAIMVDVYHELEYPHEVLQNIKAALKPKGKLLLLEYKGEDPSIPIKALHKMTVIQADRELKANGFTRMIKTANLPIQHFLLYQKD